MTKMTNCAEQDAVRLERRGAVATITMNRASVHNALDPEAIALVNRNLDEVECDPDIRCLVLCGAGDKTFTAGYDLKNLARIDPATLRSNPLPVLIDRIFGFPIPVVGAINGHAVGAGFHLMLACDLRVGQTGSKFFVPAAQLGLVYNPSALSLMTREFGLSFAKRLMLAGERFGISDLDTGMFFASVEPAGEVAPKAFDIAEQVASGAPLAIRGMKRILNAPDLSKEEILALENACYDSKDLREGIRASGAGDTPTFVGA